MLDIKEGIISIVKSRITDSVYFNARIIVG